VVSAKLTRIQEVDIHLLADLEGFNSGAFPAEAKIGDKEIGIASPN
jgi:hypothetical protein